MICLVKTRDVIAMWQEIAGQQITEDEANQTIEELGRSLFTHHAAAMLCLTDNSIDNPAQAANAIRLAIVSGTGTNNVDFGEAIEQKRTRILK